MSNLLEILHQEKIETRILEDKYLISNFIKSTDKKSVFFYLSYNFNFILKKIQSFINIKLYSNKFVNFLRIFYHEYAA
jgi:hypothetical protein